MKHYFKYWDLLHKLDGDAINNATLTTHHAIQLVAAAGKYLAPPKEDDSHTNMQWIDEPALLAGSWIMGLDKFRVAFDIKEMDLIILNDGNMPASHLKIANKTKAIVLAWLKQQVELHGVDASKLNFKMHYEIPPHHTDEGKQFKMSPSEVIQELVNYRHNADRTLTWFSKKFKDASSVRIWPHHFDSGSYIPVAHDNKGAVTHSIGIGLAIPDDKIQDHYFYVNHWQKEKAASASKLPSLDGVGKWYTKGWVGAYLPLSDITEISEAGGQAQLTHNFFTHAINASLDFINQPEVQF